MEQVKKTINGIAKRNKYILTAVIDKAGNMLKSVDGKKQYLTVIPEHDERINVCAYGSKFVIDMDMFEVLNGPVPFKYTYLMDDNHNFEPLAAAKYCMRYRGSDIERVMLNHEIYKRETLFFMGGEKFIHTVLPYIDTLMLTVIDHDFTDEAEIVSKFPIEICESIFGHKKIEHSQISEILTRQRKGYRPSNTEVTIISEHMKLITKVKKVKKVELPSYGYEFITYQR